MTVHAQHQTHAKADDPEPASTSDDPPEHPGRAGAFIVDFDQAAPGPNPDLLAWLHGHLLGLARRLGVSGELRVRLVGDTEMAAAHHKYLGEASTTDVLTFDLAHGASANGAPIDADLLVCVDEAHRRAAEFGHGPERELLLYMLHGLLHCLGHDDHDARGYERMHALEDELLGAIGVGATFAPGRERAEPGA